MSQVVFSNLNISGITAAIPSQVINNHDWDVLLGKNITEKVINNIGVEFHRKAARRQTAGDLAFEAAKRILEEKKISPDEIGIVVFVTTTPDYMVPSTAFVIHKRLGLSVDCIPFDINHACAGYPYGIQVVGSMIQNIEKKYALLLCGHAPKHLDISNRKNPDHSSLMMFGDAATATLIERSENINNTIIDLYADSSNYLSLCTLGGCRCIDASRDVSIWSDGKEHSLFDAGMDGMEVFKFATTKVPASINNFLQVNKFSINEFDDIFLHQSNKLINHRIQKQINVPEERCYMSLNKFGNTSSCSIPLGIVDAYGDVNDDSEKKVLLCGFGAGMSWGIVSCTINPLDIYSYIESDNIYEEGELKPF